MTIRVRVRPGALLVRADGHLTSEAAVELYEQVLRELAPKPRDVVLDLGQVASIDAGALAWVFRLQLETEQNDTRLVLAGQSAAVQRLLEKTNVRAALQFAETEEEALRGAVSSA